MSPMHLVPKPLSSLFPLAILLLALSGCGGAKTDDYVEKPVEELYNKAVDEMTAREYQKAAKSYDEVERQHPYSTWATKAQLMAGYSLYKADKRDEAIVALDRFIQLHPGNRDAAYAYYLKGLCYYEQITDVARDQKITQQAMTVLQEVVDRFPDSRYSRDAKIKLDLTRDHLAGKEMDIGRYYLRQRQYLAAINRFQKVVNNYQTTTHVPEALHRLSEAYTALGLTDEAQKMAAILGHNFPGSDWYGDSYRMVAGAPPEEADTSPPSESPPPPPPRDAWYKRAWHAVF